MTLIQDKANAKKSFISYPLGQVYSLGRAEYGRLGLGQGAEERSEPTPVVGMEPSCAVACGASVSYAVTKEGNKASSRGGGYSKI